MQFGLIMNASFLIQPIGIHKQIIKYDFSFRKHALELK